MVGTDVDISPNQSRLIGWVLTKRLTLKNDIHVIRNKINKKLNIVPKRTPKKQNVNREFKRKDSLTTYHCVTKLKFTDYYFKL